MHPLIFARVGDTGEQKSRERSAFLTFWIVVQDCFRIALGGALLIVRSNRPNSSETVSRIK